MEALFKEIATQYNGNYSVTESSWYNGHAYLPLYSYSLTFSHKEWDFKIRHEFRSSEFTKPKAVNLGSFADRHLFDINVSKSNTDFPNFEIVTPSFFAKLIGWGRTRNFKVKSSNTSLIRYCSNNPQLVAVCEYVNLDAEFSPQFIGVNKSRNYNLTIRYATQQKRVDLLKNLLDFLTQIPSIKI
ncbi:hypothetical protein [Flavobacterium litorale]|uniref:Uncharacterized protein n=1 Tax=Flavobacterium litorale TaxID=2856519 RepID=A0ABX8V7M8_9FLAO|nr:hypothetical protein [Flavobacterium litorale]QYJ68853.1 hypothetical protein K1I41_02935 [Flavobacterium litorale]